jgi:hypothetical protein
MLGSVKPGSTIWVHRYDRFGRNKLAAMKDIKELAQRRIYVRSIDAAERGLQYWSNPADMTRLETIFAQAEQEGNNISRNVKSYRDAILAAGGCPGAAPYGTRFVTSTKSTTADRKKRTREEIIETMSGGKINFTATDERLLEADPYESKVVKLIHMMLSGNGCEVATLNNMLKEVAHCRWEPLVFYNPDGSVATRITSGLSYTETAAWLNEYAVTYRKNKDWNAGIVKRVYENITSAAVVISDEGRAKPAQPSELDDIINSLNRQIQLTA